MREKRKKGENKFHSSLFDTVRLRVRISHGPLHLQRQENPERIIYAKREYRVRGRFKGTYAVIASADRSRSAMYIEASIPKYLTGQNVVGIEDLKQGSIELIEEVLSQANIQPSHAERKIYLRGDFTLMRVDYANHLWCGDETSAEFFMRALRKRMAAKAWAYSAYRDETVYLRQHSKRATLKGYDKGKELRKRPLGSQVRYATALRTLAKGLVRFELTLRAEELKRLNLHLPAAWSAEIARKLLNEHVRRMIPLEGMVPRTSNFSGLRPLLRDRLELFLRGAVDAFTRNRGSLPANKRDVMKHTGIDITSVLTPEEQANAFLTLRQIFKEGWGYRSWPGKWEALKAGAQG
jgi:hypothetical protein